MLHVDVEFYTKGKVEGKIKFQNVNMELCLRNSSTVMDIHLGCHCRVAQVTGSYYEFMQLHQYCSLIQNLH